MWRISGWRKLGYILTEMMPYKPLKQLSLQVGLMRNKIKKHTHHPRILALSRLNKCVKWHLYQGQKVTMFLWAEMLKCIYSSYIEGGACYRQACATLYWSIMQAEIKHFVSNCLTCNEFVHNQQKETMLSHDIPSWPWVAQSSAKGLSSISEIFRRLSCFLIYLQRQSSSAARLSLLNIVRQIGWSQIMALSLVFCLGEFEHITSPPRHPKFNGVGHQDSKDC